MSYTDQDTILKTGIPEYRLNELITDASSPDTDILTECIAWADAIIDDKLRKRYTLPFVTTPKAITDISTDFTLYRLHFRNDAVSEQHQKAYEMAMARLNAIRDGKDSLDLDESQTEPASMPMPAKAFAPVVFSADVMKGY